MKRVQEALTAAICILLGAGAAQAQLGNPNDPYSCYSHCTEKARMSGSTVTCYCDLFCQLRGDCCADKNEFCSVEDAAPYCALTNTSEFADFCGTDLGFNVVHNGQIDVLFGDTFHGTPCKDDGAFSLTSDDSQGHLPLARPSWVPGGVSTPTTFDCPAGTLTMDLNAGRSSFQPIMLYDQNGANIALPAADTPLTAFRDGTQSWAVFGQGLPPLRRVHFAYNTGGTSYRVPTAVMSFAPSTKFQNPSAAVVTNLTNFATPSTGGVLLMFGRPRFFSTPTDDPATNRVYLFYQNLPLSTTGSNWSPQYFTGFNANGSPKWSPDFNAAVPIMPADFHVANQMDIKWIPEIKKWVMLYGGSTATALGVEGVQDEPRHGAIHVRMANYPWGPWTRPTPALFRERMAQYYHCDATSTSTPAGCDAPWSIGTWTEGGSAAIPGCRTDLTQPVPFNGSCSSQYQRGNLYSPNMITPWTAGWGYEPISKTYAATLYLSVASWFPYQVDLAIMDVRIHADQIYDFGITAQIRDRNNGMVSRASTTTLSRQAGSPAPNAPINTAFNVFWLASASGCPNSSGRGPVIGDTVYFYNTFNGNKVLARSGTALTYVDLGTQVPASAQWVLESTNSANYPNCTPIQFGTTFGTTPFHIKSATSAQWLRSNNGLTLSSTASSIDTTYNWTFNLGCLNGDSCAAAN